MGILKPSFFISLLKCLLIILFISQFQFAQNSGLKKYQYISPVPNSSMNMPETNIIIRQGSFINPQSLSSESFKLVGTKSGDHTFIIKLADDDKTILINPISKFSLGETVKIYYSDGILSNLGIEFPGFDFQFRITETDPSLNFKTNADEILDLGNEIGLQIPENRSVIITFQNSDNYPSDFPAITIKNSSNPSPGYFFIAPILESLIPFGYLKIIDNNGIPIFYRRRNGLTIDWKLQPNGQITFFDLADISFYAMDSSYSIVDTIQAGNGYKTNLHELRILQNGHVLLIANDRQSVRMDTIVTGGNPNTIVDGLIIQEIDADKNVIFQWRSWDHFKITDATRDINLTSSTIDYVHGNAIEVDTDGNLLLSCRHMDEITKIDRETGNIIWRWGGTGSKNNQFTFINDPVTFSHQHHIRLLPNGNYTLFDNGNLHIPTNSRALEYHLDQVNKTAELVWSFQYNPTTYSVAMGSNQRLSNNRSIIGWGWSFTDPRAVTEVSDDGSVALELLLPDNFLSYRAFKFPWKTNLFVTNPDSLFFDSVYVGNTSSAVVEIINNSSDSLTITGFYNTNSAFSVTTDSLPLIIPPFGSTLFTINFIPDEYGDFKDILHIRSDTDTSRVAQVMTLKGNADTLTTGVKRMNNLLSYKLKQNYPNPFNPVTTIEFEIPEREFVSLKVFDVRGSEVADLIDGEKSAGSYKVKFNASKLSTGIYFYRLQAGDYIDTKKLLLLK